MPNLINFLCFRNWFTASFSKACHTKAMTQSLTGIEHGWPWFTHVSSLSTENAMIYFNFSLQYDLLSFSHWLSMFVYSINRLIKMITLMLPLKCNSEKCCLKSSEYQVTTYIQFHSASFDLCWFTFYELKIRYWHHSLSGTAQQTPKAKCAKLKPEVLVTMYNNS